MTVAIIGSRTLSINSLSEYLPEDTDKIVSGGAYGIDTSAKIYARKKGIEYVEIRPDYKTHGKKAPILRNIEIINLADIVLAFWDGKSNGTRFVIKYCRNHGIKCRIFLAKK